MSETLKKSTPSEKIINDTGKGAEPNVKLKSYKKVSSNLKPNSDESPIRVGKSPASDQSDGNTKSVTVHTIVTKNTNPSSTKSINTKRKVKRNATTNEANQDKLHSLPANKPSKTASNLSKINTVTVLNSGRRKKAGVSENKTSNNSFNANNLTSKLTKRPPVPKNETVNNATNRHNSTESRGKKKRKPKPKVSALNKEISSTEASSLHVRGKDDDSIVNNNETLTNFCNNTVLSEESLEDSVSVELRTRSGDGTKPLVKQSSRRWSDIAREKLKDCGASESNEDAVKRASKLQGLGSSMLENISQVS